MKKDTDRPEMRAALGLLPHLEPAGGHVYDDDLTPMPMPPAPGIPGGAWVAVVMAIGSMAGLLLALALWA